MNTEVKQATKRWRERLGLPIGDRDLELENLVPGLHVLYTHPNNGYPSDQLHAKQYLKLNGIYVVKSFDIGNWQTDVWLEGFDDPFNSVMFDEVQYDDHE